MIDPIQARNRGIVTLISLLVSVAIFVAVFFSPRSWSSYVFLIQVINLAVLFNLGKLFPNSRP